MEHSKGFCMKKCTKCNGHKQILGMGGMKSKCTDCAGLGFMVEAKKIDDVKVDPVKTVITPFVKPHSKKVKLTEVKVSPPA